MTINACSSAHYDIKITQSIMNVFIIVFFVFMLIIGLMSVGVLMGRKPLKGSCGGVPAALGEVNDPDYECPICGDNPNKCPDNE